MDKKTQALVEQYAKSLVEVALEKDSLAEIQAEIGTLVSIFEKTDLKPFLSNLAVSRDEKVKIVRLFQESSSVYMNNFLEVILQNEREIYLFAILESVQKEIAKVTNQYDVIVTSAVSLTAEQKERIYALIDSKFNIKVRNLIEKIDDTILGGFIISVNNKVIDTSIRRQLQTLKMNLK